MMAKENLDILKRIGDVQRSLELLKRDLMKGIKPKKRKKRISLFGSIRSKLRSKDEEDYV